MPDTELSILYSKILFNLYHNFMKWYCYYFHFTGDGETGQLPSITQLASGRPSFDCVVCILKQYTHAASLTQLLPYDALKSAFL